MPALVNWWDLLKSGGLILAGLAVPTIALCLKIGVVEKYRERQRSTPTEEKLLRPPGYSLQQQLGDKLNDALMIFLCSIGSWTLAALLLPMALDSAQYLFVHRVGIAVLGPFLVFVTLGTWTIVRTTRSLTEISNLRLGLRGEQAVGEMLIELVEQGYRSFHDLPAGKNWNVDHVTVGCRGVFVLETKVRRKPRRGKAANRPIYKVTQDSETLRFPDWEDRHSIRQTVANARWVADYLTKKTGEKVATEAIVVLPGWWVDQTGTPSPVRAMNPKYLASYLKGQPKRLEPAQVRRIIAALEEKCRTLEF